MTPPLKGAIIGAGYFARFHCEAWTRIPEVRITSICDTVEEKARQYKMGGAVYTDWRRMIDAERPDFIDIATPPDIHEQICAEAAVRGIHVLCQKPLAPTLEASRRIVEITTTAGIRFMVHENWRWQPWYRRIKQLQLEGTLGHFTHLLFLMRMGDGWGENAYLDRQPFFRHYPRLLIFETGVHFVDTFRFLLGEVTEVYAHLRRLNPVIKGEDAGQIFFKFENGATAIWDANRYNETEALNPRYTFGDLRIDATGGHLTLDPEANIRIKPLGQPAFVLPYPHKNMNFAGDCVHATLTHFVQGLLTGTEFETSGPNYLRTLEVVEAIYRSAETGHAQQLD